MRIIVKLLLTLLVITPLNSYGSDSIRIVNYSKYLHVYNKIGPSFSRLEIHSPDTDKTLKIEPNPASEITLGFNYSWLGLSYTFVPPANQSLDSQFGKTIKNDFEAHITTNRLMVDLTFKKYKGFYLANPESFMDSWEDNGVYPRIPDLQTSTASVSFAYIFSPQKYSPNAAYTYTRAMRKSGGSWMIGGFATSNKVLTDTSIIPGNLKLYIDPKYDLQQIKFSDIGVSLGYSYLLTIAKKNFISATLLPGLSFQRIVQQSAINETEIKNNAVSLRSIIRISAGRNGDKCYWGLNAFLQSSMVENNESEVSLNSGHVAFFIGYRINTDNWKFMKGVDKVLHPPGFRFLTGQPPQRN